MCVCIFFIYPPFPPRAMLAFDITDATGCQGLRFLPTKIVTLCVMSDERAVAGMRELLPQCAVAWISGINRILRMITRRIVECCRYGLMVIV